MRVPQTIVIRAVSRRVGADPCTIPWCSEPSQNSRIRVVVVALERLDLHPRELSRIVPPPECRLGTLWSAVADVRSARNLAPREPQPVEGLGLVTSWTRCRSSRRHSLLPPRPRAHPRSCRTASVALVSRSSLCQLRLQAGAEDRKHDGLRLSCILETASRSASNVTQSPMKPVAPPSISSTTRRARSARLPAAGSCLGGLRGPPPTAPGRALRDSSRGGRGAAGSGFRSCGRLPGRAPDVAARADDADGAILVHSSGESRKRGRRQSARRSGASCSFAALDL